MSVEGGPLTDHELLGEKIGASHDETMHFGQLTEEELEIEKKLKLKIDLRIMPWVILVYLMNYIDRYVIPLLVVCNSLLKHTGTTMPLPVCKAWKRILNSMGMNTRPVFLSCSSHTFSCKFRRTCYSIMSVAHPYILAFLWSLGGLFRPVRAKSQTMARLLLADSFSDSSVRAICIDTLQRTNHISQRRHFSPASCSIYRNGTPRANSRSVWLCSTLAP